MIALISCNKEKEAMPNTGGQLKIELQERINDLKSAGFITSLDSIYAAVISIENQQGVKIFEMKVLELFNMNGQFISAPISLNVGNYKLTDFLLTDKNNRILFATPKEGSNQAKLVDHPLDILFNIRKDEVTNVVPEVLKVTVPEDFGYASFGFQIIKTIDFLLSVFVYDENVKSFVLSKATLTISDGAEYTHLINLESVTNTIIARDSIINYSLTVEKAGYQTYKKTFSSAEIRQYTHGGIGPLIIILNKPDSNGSDKWFNVYGTPAHEFAYSTCQTRDGGYIICGVYDNWDTGPKELYIIKTDCNGNIVWEKRYNEVMDGRAIKLLGNGHYIVYGHTKSYDLCLMEVDDQGNKVWFNSYNQNDYDYSSDDCLEICSDGGFIVAGSSFIGNNGQIVVIKTSNKGAEEWRRSIKGDYNYYPSGIVQVADGYLIAGRENKDSWPMFQYQISLIKLDESGNIAWNKDYNTTSTQYSEDILLTEQKEIYILGTDGIGGNVTHPKMLLKKVDQDGTELWTKMYDSNFLPTHHGLVGSSLTESTDGNIFLLGNTNEEQDIFITKVDKQGNELKKNFFGITNYFAEGNNVTINGNDFGYQVVSTADDGCIITGFTTAFGGGWTDMFLLKLDIELQSRYSFNSIDKIQTLAIQ